MCVSFTSLSNNVLMWRVDFTPVVYKWMLSVKSLPFGLFPHVSARCFEGGSMPTLCSFFHFISLMRLLLVVGRRGEGRVRSFRNPVPPSPHPSIFSKKSFRLDPAPFPLSSSAPPPSSPSPLRFSSVPPHPNRYLWTDCSLISRNESSNVSFLA